LSGAQAGEMDTCTHKGQAQLLAVLTSHCVTPAVKATDAITQLQTGQGEEWGERQ
jgi:hypothetical protein